MKKIIIALSLLLSSLMMNPVIDINAETIQETNLEISKIETTNKPGVGMVIKGYNGPVPEGEVILPSHIDGEIIHEVIDEAFNGAGLSGALILPETITWVAPMTFANNQLTSVKAPGLENIAERAFKNNKITDISLDNVMKIEYRAFYNNEIVNLSLPNVEYIGFDAFGSNQIETLSADNVIEIAQGAFWKQKLKVLNLPRVKSIGQGAFEGNDLTTVSLPEVAFVAQAAFINNKIEHIEMPKLVTAQKDAFKYNELTHISLPELKVVGDSAFAHNKLETVDLPQLEIIEEAGFYQNELKTLSLPALKEIGLNAFHYNQLEAIYLSQYPNLADVPFMYNQPDNPLGYFPLYITDVKENNVISEDLKIVINPNENFLAQYIEDLDLDDDEIYLYGVYGEKSNYGLATARNIEDELFYCVGSTMVFVPGIYKTVDQVKTIYVVDHGYYEQDATETPRHQIVAINEAPESYLYAYDANLVSKLIWHADRLFAELGDTDYVRDRIVHLVASNPELVDVDVTIDNFREVVSGTSMYRWAKDDIGEAFLTSLFDLIENDARDYTDASYYYYSDHDKNEYPVSQPLFKPGQPIDEKVSVSISKEWYDQAGKMLEKTPDKIIFDLFANETLLQTVELSEETYWNITLGNLDKFDEQGALINYRVFEHDVPGFSRDVEVLNDYMFVLKNTQEPESPRKEPPHPKEPNKPHEPEIPEEEGVAGVKKDQLPQTGMAAYSSLNMMALSFVVVGILVRVILNKRMEN